MKCRQMSRVFKNQPNSNQKKTLHQECVREFDKLLELYNRQVALQVLHILRFKCGWGKKRLRRFSDWMKEMQITTVERYEATDNDVPDICEIQLRDSGINLDEFLKE